MVFDPSDRYIDMSHFNKRDWTTTKFGLLVVKEVLPHNMREPRGMGFTV